MISDPLARVIAFYLPQFHQIPENDEWWGEGFTEWINVRKAKPLYRSHAQPRVPGRLGYYNLLDAAIREEQADLAKNYGVEGFCYWHYWFGNGRRILEAPFQMVLESGTPDLPFCLCWANQSWTGVWHGAPRRMLLEQTYPGVDDYISHFESILPALRDKRYITCEGRPVFLVYTPSELPDPGEFIALWDRLAKAAGLPGIYFIGMTNEADTERFAAFDQLMQFGPTDFVAKQPRRSDFVAALRKAACGPLGSYLSSGLLKKLGAPARYPYAAVVQEAFRGLPRSDRYVPCIMPGWDNTPRSGRRGVVFEDATAELFAEYVRKALNQTSRLPRERRFIFVKAWNEWAEGNFLEPTQDDDCAFLDALRSVLFNAHPQPSRVQSDLVDST